MSIVEKIYYTWLILAIPTSICLWMFFDDPEEHPILFNLICTFIWLPIAIGLASMLIWAVVQVWQA